MALTTKVRRVGDVSIVDLHGKITLGENTGILRDELKSLLAQGTKNIVLNMADVSYVDSAGLGELVGAYTTATNQGGSVKLLNMQGKMKDLMQITKLHTIFSAFDNEQAAVVKLRQQRGRQARRKLAGHSNSQPLDAVIVHARHSDHTAHLEEPGAGSFAYPLFESCAEILGAGDARFFQDGTAHIGIDKIGCRNQRLAVVVAVGHDGGNSVFHPIRDAVRSQVVQKQNLRFERDSIGFAATGSERFAVACAYTLQQILIIEENAFVPTRKQQPKSGYRQMRLARSRRTR